MKRLFLVLFLAIATSANAQSTLEKLMVQYPKPDTSFVLDGANVISPEDEIVANRVLRQLYDSTKSPAVIVTIPNLMGLQSYEVATAIGDRWGVATKDATRGAEQFGLVLLISPKETNDNVGKCFIATSMAMEAHLTDHRAAEVCRQLVPQFKTRDYSGAVVTAAGILNEKMHAAILADKTPKAPPVEYEIDWALLWLILGIMATSGALLWFGWKFLYWRSTSREYFILAQRAEGEAREWKSRLNSKGIEMARETDKLYQKVGELEQLNKIARLRYDELLYIILVEGLANHLERAIKTYVELVAWPEAIEEDDSRTAAALEAERQRKAAEKRARQEQKRREKEEEEARERARTSSYGYAGYSSYSSDSSSSSSSDSSWGGSSGGYSGGGGGSDW